MNIDFLRFLPVPAEIIVILALVFTLIAIIINLLFASGVGDDANKLRREGARTQIVGQATWVIATLFGGVFVAAIYWAIHRSNLNRKEETPPI